MATNENSHIRRDNAPVADRARDAASETFRGKGMGMIPDPPDPRDWSGRQFLREQGVAIGDGVEGKATRASLLSQIKATRPWDQGALGSCTAFGVNRCMAHQRRVQGQPYRDPSFLATYWWTRYMMGGEPATLKDTGASPRTAIQSAKRYGIAPASLLPYDERRFAERPSDQAVAQAGLHQAVQYYALSDGDVDGIMAAIRNGRVVMFAIPIYTNFGTDDRGVVPPARGQIEGYHQMTLYGFDGSYLRGINQWGQDWGVNGLFKIDPQFVRSEGFGLWFVNLVEVGD